MLRSLFVLGVCAFVTAVAGFAAAQEPAADDAAATQALQAQVEAGLAAIQAGDITLFRGTQAQASIYDLGMDSNPVQLYGPEAVNGFLESLASMVQEGGTIAINPTRTECHAVADLGYCLVESAQTFTMGDETVGPLQFRNTFIMRRAGDTWVNEHIHASLAAWPEGMMAEPQAEEAPQ